MNKPHIYRNILTEDYFQVVAYTMLPLEEVSPSIELNKREFQAYIYGDKKFEYISVLIDDENAIVYTDMEDLKFKSLVFNATQSVIMIFAQLEFLGAVIEDSNPRKQQYLYERVL